MNDTQRLLDAVKKAKGLPSDYALAPFLGVTRSHVSKWRVGRESLSDEKALQVAETLDLEPSYVLALMAAERAERAGNAYAVEIWSKLAALLKKTYGQAAALGVVLAWPVVGMVWNGAAAVGRAAVCILC